MKKVLIIVGLLSGFGLLAGCDDNEDPTTFRGKVVFPEGDERAAKARVLIIGHNSRGTLIK